jgi:acyl-CoA synthetase (AMP-forming)/AMP-acid ligase II
MVFAGYDGETAAVVDPDGWWRTTDVGSLDREGYLTVIGRADDLLVSGGENVDPREVEAVLCAHPMIADALVVGVPDARWGQVPVAVIVARPADDTAGSQPDDDELIQFSRSRLAAFKVPRTFVRVPALPRAANGKLRRRAARAIALAPR